MLVPARDWRFKSSLGHKKESWFTLRVASFLLYSVSFTINSIEREVFRNGSTAHVSRKCSDFEVKTLKSEQGYRDNLTSFERFSTEIRTFYETSSGVYIAVRH